jgi:hypothetical protein
MQAGRLVEDLRMERNIMASNFHSAILMADRLFYSHYSFLGLNPTGLSDSYTNYFTQNKAHTLINYNYCKTNPQSFNGYSDQCWGLTASDIPDGYNANSPTNDKGVISPTAALSAFPYAPCGIDESVEVFLL